jgi:hypothetical protein
MEELGTAAYDAVPLLADARQIARHVDEHDERHGEGIEIYVDGDKYAGSWSHDHFHGHGTYTWSDGASYVGDWNEGKFHGFGILTNADGTRQEGFWEDDRFIGEQPDALPAPRLKLVSHASSASG